MVIDPWRFEPPSALFTALGVALGLAILSLACFLAVIAFALSWSRAEQRRAEQHEVTVLRLGEARGRQEVLDDVRMLEHGQLKAHVLAVQHCLILARGAGMSEERDTWLNEGLAQIHRLLEVVVNLHQAVTASALPDDLEQTVVDVVQSLAVAYPACACRVEVNGRLWMPLDEAARRALILVLYNALQNAFSHGGPSQVMVQLQYAPDALILVIADDGYGIAASEGRRGGRGLRDVRRLIENHGGTLTITSAVQAGTCLTAVFPLGNAACRQDPGEKYAALSMSQPAVE